MFADFKNNINMCIAYTKLSEESKRFIEIVADEYAPYEYIEKKAEDLLEDQIAEIRKFLNYNQGCNYVNNILEILDSFQSSSE